MEPKKPESDFHLLADWPRVKTLTSLSLRVFLTYKNFGFL